MPADNSLRNLIRGDVQLAKAIFGDQRKRRLIPQLQAEGWPIFDLAGKRCAIPAELDAAITHARKAAQRRHMAATHRGRGRSRKAEAQPPAA